MELGYLHTTWMENQDTSLNPRNVIISESLLLGVELLPCMTLVDLLQSLLLLFLMLLEPCLSEAKPD